MAYTPIKLAASLSGNTDGVLANISTGTLYLAGGNNVTLSQNGNSVTFSGPHTSQFLTTAALSQNSSNYAGIGETVGTVAGTDLGLTVNTDGVSIKHPNWLTTAALSQNTSNYAGVGETVGTIIGTDLAMTVNTDGVSIKHPNWLTTAAASNHSHGNPTLALTNLTGTTASNSAGLTISLSAANAGGAGYTAGLSDVGNTSGDTGAVTGRLIFAGGNNVTLSGSTDAGSMTITVSGMNAYSAGISTNGNTAGYTGYGTNRLVLIGGNNITLSGSTEGGSMSLTISAGAGGAGSNTLGMSNLGNTSGNTGVISGSALQYIFAGGNNITLSQSIMSNSATVTISAGNIGSDTEGMSNIGNTSGTTGVISGPSIQMVFAGGNNITLSQSIMSNSATITISAANTGLAGNNTIGMSNLGNTTGTTGVLSSSQNQYLFAGGNNITLSQSIMSNSATLTISGLPPGAQSMAFWQNMGVNGSATDAMAQTTITYNNLHVFQLDIGNNIFAGNMTVKTLLMDITGSIAATIPSYTVSAFFGIYTINASTALSLLYSASVSFGTSGSSPGATSFSHQSLINGRRYLTMDGTLFTGISGFALSQALYYGAVLYRSSSNSASLSIYGAILGESGQRSGTFGAASVTNTYIGAMPFMGVFSTTTAGMPASIASQALRKTAIADIFIPHIMFNNIQASF